MISAEKGGCVTKERGSRAPPSNENSSHRWTDQARAVKDRTIERDGGRDLLPPNEFRNQRVDRRHLERDAGPEAERQDDDVPDLNPSAVNEKPKRKREHDLNNLGPDQDSSFVVAIRRFAALHRQQNRRDAGRRGREPEQESAVRQRAHHPALGHHLHPRARVRDRRADDVTPKRSLPHQRQACAAKNFSPRRPSDRLIRGERSSRN